MVEDTSLEAFENFDHAGQQAKVLAALGKYPDDALPTSYELTEAMMRAGTAYDLNSVRPTLTHLKDLKKVEKVAKRKCGVTTNTAYTWRVIK